jgi:hypothetical protein
MWEPQPLATLRVSTNSTGINLLYFYSCVYLELPMKITGISIRLVKILAKIRTVCVGNPSAVVIAKYFTFAFPLKEAFILITFRTLPLQ